MKNFAHTKKKKRLLFRHPSLTVDGADSIYELTGHYHLSGHFYMTYLAIMAVIVIFHVD